MYVERCFCESEIRCLKILKRYNVFHPLISRDSDNRLSLKFHSEAFFEAILFKQLWCISLKRMPESKLYQHCPS